MQQENGILKEGFLVKRGHIVHNWKARWFVLQANKLSYYKVEGGRRKSSCQKGEILLDGCTVTCPCLEYESRPLVIKLKSPTCTEYFLEACSREDRDAWAADITEAIRSLSPEQSNQLSPGGHSFSLPTNISLNHIIDKMRDSSSGIKPITNMEQGSTYKESFTGSSLVDWLVSWNFVSARFEAVTLMSMLMEENFIKPIGVRSTEATRYTNLAEQFLDDSTALYAFAESLKKKGSFKEEIQLNAVEMSGTIVKQGYLAKQLERRPPKKPINWQNGSCRAINKATSAHDSTTGLQISSFKISVGVCRYHIMIYT
uniref:Pleckstrin-2 isoform X2 n=1 Tax=Geotrypetes seraphini TaxID=260995 RepID=A0A6P8RSM7_GEOSA|nr:pleckstrin-2 isoform X2 [Geotrypetes seraphini]